MIINWVSIKAQQFWPEQDTKLDEFNDSFDFALSPEVMTLLYAQNDGGMKAGQQSEAGNITATKNIDLDEYELALT